jgi:MFS family permease
MTPWFSAAAVLPQLHVSAAAAPWLAIAVQLGFVLGAFLCATLNLCDYLPPRVLMGTAAIGAALSNLALLASSDAWSAIGLRFLTGLFLAHFYPAALKLTATWYRRGRGVAFGCVIGALTLGSAAPHLLNALGGVDWHRVIVGTTVAAAVGGLGTAALLREGPYPFPRSWLVFSQLREVLLDRSVVLASLGYLGHMWELYAMWTWLLYFARGVFAESGSLASLATFAIVAAGAPACVLAGALADRFGRARTTIVLLLTSGACSALVGLTYRGPDWAFLCVGFVWGAAVIADSGQYSALVSEVADRRYVGTALAAQLGLGFALTSVTIWLVPAAAAWLGSWQWVFLVLLPGPAVGVAAMTGYMITRDARRSE